MDKLTDAPEDTTGHANTWKRRRIEALSLLGRTYYYVSLLRAFLAFELFELGWRAITGGRCHKYHFVATKSDKHVFVATKHVFCHDRNMLVTTKYFYCDKYLLKQKYVFVARKLYKYHSCRNKNVFVATNVILLTYFCRDKTRILSRQTRVFRNKTFVAAEMILVASPANDREQEEPAVVAGGYRILLVTCVRRRCRCVTGGVEGGGGC